MRQDYHDQIIDNKNRGATDGRYLLSWSAGTTVGEKKEHQLSVVDIENPRTLLSNDDVASNASLSYLRERAEKYYGDEISSP